MNTDLRDAFRDEFPRARWFLVETSKNLAEERLLAREGHFYKSDSTRKSNSDEGVNARENEIDQDNSEWNFRPVTFPHIVLDGRDSVEDNAKRIEEYRGKLQCPR